MTTASLPLLDSFSALADPTRCRMLSLLDRHELTVSELCAVLQLPQSTVSRHLKTLADAAWVASRRDGTSRYYALAAGSEDDTRARLWDLTRAQLDGRAGLEQDARRLARILAERSETSKQFFSSVAGKWDHMREELFGRDFALRALAGLLPSDSVVGDLGCGTGATVAALAPFVARVIGVDGSADMLRTAKDRLADSANVDLRQGDLERLPIDDDSLDAATMMLVLHHLPAPAAAVTEAARILKPGGRLLIVDMAPHEQEQYRREMGHVWFGFSDEQIHKLLAQAGFTNIRLHPLPPDTTARGPALFAATAERAEGRGQRAKGIQGSSRRTE